MADRVRGYQRGGERVRPHSRSSRGRSRKPLLSPGHAWKLLKRSWRAGRRKKKGLALTLGFLGVAEFTSWLTADTVGKLLTTAGVLAMAGGALTLGLTGGNR